MDSTPYRVFKISELARHIASHLTVISRKNALNLACACRCLEEPVLSTIWEDQERLEALLKTLPEENWRAERVLVWGDTVRALVLPLGKSNA